MNGLNRGARLILVLLLAAGSPAAADVWDNVTEDDDAHNTTNNRLNHGAVQVHDLAAPGGVQDLDFFFLDLAANASYEVLVDGFTGDLDFITGGTDSDIVRMDINGVVVQDALGTNAQVPVRWKTGPGGNFINYIRVRSSNCGAGCNTNDEYTIRFRQTTYAIPRFNNSATQTTVLIVNSLGSSTCTPDFLFFNANGTLLGTHTDSINNGSTMVLNTATLPFAAGTSGMIKVLHTCPFGTLTGKAVAVEPGTGFTFDTLMVPVPY
jgi:hypothetical protein